MTNDEDPRITATRIQALNAALELLQSKGVLAVTHGSVSSMTGISRSTLYRHWPTLEDLRNRAFVQAIMAQDFPQKSENGPLRADVVWLLVGLVNALNDTAWGQIAPQVAGTAVTDDSAKSVINKFMEDRYTNVRRVFDDAKSRGEIAQDLDIEPLIELTVAVPYFRKIFAGLQLDEKWLESHVDLICKLATN